jgi:N-methylhydantoinase A
MAEGIVRLATSALANAIKEISVMRGIDPRNFALLSYGGAGPLHSAGVAEELGIRSVVVPPEPGNFSAFGLLVADYRRDLAKTWVSLTETITPSHIRDVFYGLVKEGDAELEAAGVPAEMRRFSASLDMRFRGQSHEMTVSVDMDVAGIEAVNEVFRSSYRARYGRVPQAPIEIVNYRIAAIGVSEKVSLPKIKRSGRSLEKADQGVTQTHFGGSWSETRLFDRDALPIGTEIRGPALIEEQTSSTVVPIGWVAALDELGCLLLRRDGGE